MPIYWESGHTVGNWVSKIDFTPFHIKLPFLRHFEILAQSFEPLTLISFLLHHPKVMSQESQTLLEYSLGLNVGDMIVSNVLLILLAHN